MQPWEAERRDQCSRCSPGPGPSQPVPSCGAQRDENEELTCAGVASGPPVLVLLCFSTAAASHLHPPQRAVPTPLWPHLSWVNAAASAKAQHGNHSCCCCCCSLVLLAWPEFVLLLEIIPLQNLSFQHLSFKQEDFLSLCSVLFCPNFSFFDSYLSSLDPTDLSLVTFLLI